MPSADLHVPAFAFSLSCITIAQIALYFKLNTRMLYRFDREQLPFERRSEAEVEMWTSQCANSD